MNDYTRFLRKLNILLITVFIVVFGLYLGKVLSREMLIIILTAKILNSLNFLLGMKVHLKALRKSQEIFMMLVFGSMGVRIFALLALIIICYKLLNVNFYSFILVFFGFYIFFLSLEIYYLLKFEHRNRLIND